MILGIIQARMGSTRLPGKVLLDIQGKPILWHVVRRVSQSKFIDKVIVATSDHSLDHQINDFCLKNDIEIFCGSEDDVLDRYYHTAKKYLANVEDAIVRITADCPVIDPQIIDQVIELFIHSKADYGTNTNPPTYPDGLDVEVFNFKALERTWHEAEYHSEREHVTPYIRKHPEIFSQVNLKNPEDLSNLRWTLDELADYKLIQIIYQRLYREDQLFMMGDILQLLEEQTDLKGINIEYKRNEGYEKSLQKDAVVHLKEGKDDEK